MDWWEETVAPQILESGHGTFGGCFYLKQDLSTSLSQQEREPAELFSVAVQSCDPPPHATAHTCAFKAMRRECVRTCDSQALHISGPVGLQPLGLGHRSVQSIDHSERLQVTS